MCGIVGYVGPSRPALDVVIDGLRRPGVPRLRLRRRRDRRRRRCSHREAGRQARQPREGARRRPAARGDDRHRAHPLGHPRRPHRRQRPPAPRPPTAGRGRPQRHHRELRRAAGPNCSPRRAVPLARPTPRSSPTCSPRRSPAGDLAEAMRAVCRRLEGAFTLVAVHADAPRRRRRRPPQLPAGRRARRGRELPRHATSPRSSRTPATPRARPGPGRRPRRDGVDLTDFDGGPAEARQYHVDWDAVGRREGRLRVLHAQGDRTSSRGPSPTRCSAASTPTAPRPRRDAHLRRPSCATSTRSSSIACGTALPRRAVAKYAIEHWTRMPVEVELASSSATATRSSTSARWSSRSRSPARRWTP